MPTRPSGTVTFLFTDIEGSTHLWEQYPEAMQAAVAQHDALLHSAVETHQGYLVKTTGDGLFAAFALADDALAAALDAQRALATTDHRPPTTEATTDDRRPTTGEVDSPPDHRVVGSPSSVVAPVVLKVRMGLHTGPAEERDGDYFGPALNRAARLMAVAHGGQVLLSLTSYELVRDHLPVGVTLRDLGEQRLKDLARPEHVYQAVAANLPADFPPLKTLDILRNNLPVQPTALIGREKEVAAVCDLLLRPAPSTRLVTLTGPGGTGKTRLSLQVAADLIDHYPDGVFFVPLASVADPELVSPTIAHTLEAPEQAGRSLLDSLKNYLHARQMLLVLDNFEQVVAASSIVVELLAAAPRLQILVTSREVLHLYGEHAFAVPPLGLPDLQRLPAGADLSPVLSQYEAVRLFIERAQAAKSNFAITNDIAPAVAEICYRLDGLPLAIELAAARIRLLPPQAMLQRLVVATGGSPLRLLTGGARDLPARQQTLRSAIAWSYDLLDEPERALFQRLGVFAGGWTLEAAEAIGHASGELGMDILDGLESLIAKSLIRPMDEEGEARFMMLQTIREYAVERLAEAGLAEVMRQTHADFYLAFAEQAEPHLRREEQLEWLQRLEREHDNLRAALRWTLDAGQPDVALRLASALERFWYLRSRFSEGRAWLEEALAATHPAGRTPARARALFVLATLMTAQTDWGMVWPTLQESVSIARELGDRRLLALALAVLCWASSRAGERVDREAVADESLSMARSLGEPWLLAYVLALVGSRAMFLGHFEEAASLGEEAAQVNQAVGDSVVLALSASCVGLAAAARGDYDTAREEFEKALAAGSGLGGNEGDAHLLTYLGDLARLAGDYETAGPYYEKGLALYRDFGLTAHIPASLHNLGYVALARGDYATARRLQTESLTLHRQADNRMGILEATTGLAAVARATGHLEIAARLFGAVEALRASVGAPIWPAERVEYDRQVSALRAQLDAAVLEKVWAEGQAMTLEQTVASALDVASDEH